ncbi:MAG: sigma-54 dependent transcriptional regulator [Bacteroidetes bacterium]|nr:sigma-54 dependent transcriptional regulator [Bacteroidota bacterium]
MKNDFLIFIVEDDKWYGEFLEHHLTRNPDYVVRRYMNGKDCLANLHQKPNVITLDYSLPDLTGDEVLNKIKQFNPEIQVVIVSGQEDVATAIDLLKKGAYDYIVKDKDTRDRIWNVLMKIRENQDLKDQLEQLRVEVAQKYDFEKTILGKSPVITKLFTMIEKACKTNITVSISGATGTGKEMVAKAIHYHSTRQKKPFIAVNVAAIPKDLMESELFGYEKGSFTGAFARKIGKFEEATGGTIFLDEIGEMDLALQVKLLRVIQEKEVTRIGGKDLIKLDFRLIVATNKNLLDEVKKGNFREDLYYRLLGLPVHLPPLRERGNDILILAKHFADEFCKENNMKRFTFSTDAKEALLKYPYPGNVRELKAIIELSVVMANGEQLTADDISFSSVTDNSEISLEDELSLDEYYKKIINAFLKKYDNNMVLVAKKLGIGKSTIYRMRQNDQI